MQLERYDSPYYVIYSDLGRDAVREASIRLTKMFQEYTRRTSAFTVRINEKLPFYMFREPADYMAAGGLPGSAGVFKGDRLMATVRPADGSAAWHIVQHEGFHQFVDRVIGSSLPVWVDEGLAEYFGAAAFTGDAFVTGLVPPWRLVRIKEKIKRGSLPPLDEMMRLTRIEWNQRMAGNDYDQAWSMVQFLAHAHAGKYEKPFNAFLQDAGRTGVWDKAWIKHFGAGTKQFDEVWRDYWLSLPDNPTADLYAKSTVATLTSFLARAVSQGQRFTSAESYFAQAMAGELRFYKDDWLPNSLLAEALAEVDRFTECVVGAQGRQAAELACTMANGTRVEGTSAIRKRRVERVETTIIPGG